MTIELTTREAFAVQRVLPNSSNLMNMGVAFPGLDQEAFYTARDKLQAYVDHPIRWSIETLECKHHTMSGSCRGRMFRLGQDGETFYCCGNHMYHYCEDCNYDRHRCGGCGDEQVHGQRCAPCLDDLRRSAGV